MNKSKFEPEFERKIISLGDNEFITALLQPRGYSADLRFFLKEQVEKGTLRSYRYLTLAHCLAVDANREFLQNMASRSDILKISSNPNFSQN